MEKTISGRGAGRTALVGAAVVGALVVVSACTSANAGQNGAGAAVSGIVVSGEDGLRTAVDDLRDLGITGVQGLIKAGGRTDTARSGVADTATGAPVPENGYFRMGSNTKTYVAVTLLQLVGENRVSLDDPVERWLPGVVSGNGYEGTRITVRDLLQHTSGIAEYLEDIPMVQSEEGFRAHRLDHYDATELVAIAMGRPPLFAPGTSWHYSNTNYVLAGMVINKVTGNSWEQEVRTRILEPLGLRQTYAPGDDPTIRDPHALGYKQFVPDGPLVETTELNATGGDAAGALVSTPTDLATFWKALQSGKLLAPEQMAQMHQTVAAPDVAALLPGARYGLGIVRVDTACGVYWTHPGDLPGWSTLNGVSPDGERVVVLSLASQAVDPTSTYQRAHRLVEDTLCS
ncbi:serine hydrolase domain-containing protein [Umezawaea tangerina]|uniref:Alkaline D-peptidase n=1 Tax=Umezawaea tangerina TaxID=84725 RepID=A0A2T0T788_9PSEU|nr:serine hydrolase domain-containing protein [Umezawaea tangerina]PRY41502.1 alkaline D-peptidase [Umezawaea tangerina]